MSLADYLFGLFGPAGSLGRHVYRWCGCVQMTANFWQHMEAYYIIPAMRHLISRRMAFFIMAMIDRDVKVMVINQVKAQLEQIVADTCSTLAAGQHRQPLPEMKALRNFSPGVR
jgi:hypothetical protein